jgi:hypothetical protein
VEDDHAAVVVDLDPVERLAVDRTAVDRRQDFG